MGNLKVWGVGMMVRDAEGRRRIGKGDRRRLRKVRNRGKGKRGEKVNGQGERKEDNERELGKDREGREGWGIGRKGI